MRVGRGRGRRASWTRRNRAEQSASRETRASRTAAAWSCAHRPGASRRAGGAGLGPGPRPHAALPAPFRWRGGTAPRPRSARSLRPAAGKPRSVAGKPRPSVSKAPPPPAAGKPRPPLVSPTPPQVSPAWQLQLERAAPDLGVAPRDNCGASSQPLLVPASGSEYPFPPWTVPVDGYPATAVELVTWLLAKHFSWDKWELKWRMLDNDCTNSGRAFL